MNENGLRHCGQKPSVRPGGRPGNARPGLPHDGQKRRSSGTSGSRRTAAAASISGTRGTVVRPAPSRAPRNRADDVPLRAVRELPEARTLPSGALASRLEEEVGREGDEPIPDIAAPASGSAAPDSGTTDPGGMPQTSQYPSWIVPVHPGCAHAVTVIIAPGGRSGRETRRV